MGEDLIGKVEAEVELKCSPHQFFNFWKSETHQASNHTPSKIQGVKLHQGDWETSGSIKVWHYTIEGKPEVYKEKVELDEANEIVRITGIEGDVFKQFKAFNGMWLIKPKEQGSLATFTLEYEKLNPTVPTPNSYFKFLIGMTKDLDDGIQKP